MRCRFRCKRGRSAARRGAISLAGLCMVALADPAFAAEREPLGIDAEGPPPSPGLSHRGVSLDSEYTVASARPTDVVSDLPLAGGRAYSYAARVAGEWALVDRRWFVGFASEVAAVGVPPGGAAGSGGATTVFGNPELWARALWTSRIGLASGGGLGLVVPLPRSFGDAELAAVRSVRVVRPWALPHFDDLTLTARPFVDIRHVAGPVVLQLRQGLDVSVRMRGLEAGESRIELTALASVYAGVRLAEPVTLGVEVHEVYSLTEDVSSPSCLAPCDKRRVQVTLSPSVRLAFRTISPTLSVLLPLSTPLRAEVASYYATRFHLAARIVFP
jgi:hypothetical protein